MTEGQPARHGFDVDFAEFHAAQTFNTIAREQIRVGDVAGARTSARLAIDVVATMRTETSKPTPLGDAVEVLIEAGDFPAALATIESYRKRTAQPDVYLWRFLPHLAEAQQAAGDLAGARATWRRALRAAEDCLDATRRSPLRQRELVVPAAVKQVVQCQVRLHDTAAALRTIDSPEAGESRDEGLASIAAELARMGDLDSAVEMLGKIDSPEVKATAWTNLALSLPRRGAEQRRPPDPGP